MKPSSLPWIVAGGISALLTSPIQTSAQSADHTGHRTPQYTVIDLGTLGGTLSQAYGVNNKGQVGGSAALANGFLHAVLWDHPQQPKDLGTLGGPNSAAGGPNNVDELPIIAETSTLDPYGENFCGFGSGYVCLGAVWRNGHMKPLVTLGGTNGQNVGMNGHGQSVGLAETDTYDPTCSAASPNQVLQFEAVIWEANGEPRELKPLPEDSVGFALTINNLGQAAGSSGNCADTPLLPLQIGPHAVLWESDGTPLNIGSLGGKVFNTGASINDLGQVVGGSNLPGDETIHTFLWSKATGMQDLGTLGNDAASIPGGMSGINNRGEVVGQSCDIDPLTAQTPPNCRAYLWRKGHMIDLNTLISVDSPLYLNFGTGINDAGQITGLGTVKATGDTHGFVLVPCDRD